MGSCILRIAPDFDCPFWLTDTVERMQQSRMGFFVHCASEGQIWSVRVLPPPHPLCRHHVVLNTADVIRDYPERACVDYLERELARMRANKPRRTNDALGDLMKYGPDPNHWNEYIHCGYSGHRHEAIFLTAILDIRQSLPYASAYR